MDSVIQTFKSLESIGASYVANYDDTSIYHLKTFDDQLIRFNLSVPANTLNSIYRKDSIGFINIKKNNAESEKIIECFDEIRNIVYNKLKHYIRINAPNTHDQYKLRIYHNDLMINAVRYNDQKHQISFNNLYTIMHNCPCQMDIHLKTLIVGKNDFTLYMYINGLTIIDIPHNPETIRLHIIMNKEKIEHLNKYKSVDTVIRKNYISKKEIKEDILKIFNLEMKY